MANVLDRGPAMDDMIRMPLHERLLGLSAAIQEVNDVLGRLAVSDLSVLITGESGTGKDIAARMLHNSSPRFGKPFIKVNCPAVPESILESELFGYERGAFTGARSSKPGRFELANKGTIFLDEIAETSMNVQSKLLQVLDGEPVMRLGGVKPIPTDVRIIAATNMDLEQAVRENRMREDIFFRLSEVIVQLPTLRERTEDVPLLAEHFNYNYALKLGRDHTPIPGDFLAKLQEYEWPGNVRELAARVKKFVATGTLSALIDEGTASETGGNPASSPNGPSREVPDATPERTFTPLKEAARKAVEETERVLIEDALQYTLWNRRKAAKLLDISYSSLLRRIDSYGIGKMTTE